MWIFVLPNRFIDLVRIKVGIPIRIHMTVGLILGATHYASVRHRRLKTIKIVKEQAHTFFVSYFVNVLRKLCKVLEKLFVFINSNANLL